MLKKILMISYYYPPIEDVGGLRALGFSKYLPEFGWEPYVVSVKNPDKAYCVLGNGKKPNNVKVYYSYSLFNLTYVIGKINGALAKILKLFKIKLDRNLIEDLLCIPDVFIGWIPLTFIKGLSLMRKNNIDVIYVSSKPFSSVIIGAMLKHITKKPLVLDFRDPVSYLDFKRVGHKYYKNIPKFRLVRKIEEKMLRCTDKLLLASEETKILYFSYFPFVEQKTEVIYNGFMEEYFLIDRKHDTKFTIVYVGDFYCWDMDPTPFFKALQKVFSQNPVLKGAIRFLYVGDKQAWLDVMAQRHDLRDILEVTGRVSRKKSIEYMCGSSLMLLRNISPMISTKLFEGIAAGLPLLALINDGEVATIIKTYSKAPFYIVMPDDVDAIAESIKDAYVTWKDGKLGIMINPEFYKDFSKKNLTEKFSKILNKLA